jgi:thiosulfate/3-mercaptopyruvate sulfurtransferase
MSEKNRILVDAPWVKSKLQDGDVIIVDCRYNLMDHDYGMKEYRKGHIPGAYFLDLESHLSGQKGKHTGRHPLPDEQQFAERMNEMGMNKESTVIAYDDEGSGSARLWWILKFLGHDNVYILDGGIKSWIDSGYSLSRDAPEKRIGNFNPEPRYDMIVDMDQLKDEHMNLCLIDSRASERYRGEVEPIDPVAGHIPGSINMDYKSNFDETGKYLPGDVLKKKFKDIPKNPVVYCGSGVTACVNVVAMEIAGKKVLLYPGGWSQWVSYPENPVNKISNKD